MDLRCLHLANSCMNEYSQKYRSAWGGAQLVPFGIPIVWLNILSEDRTDNYMLSVKTCGMKYFGFRARMVFAVFVVCKVASMKLTAMH